MENDGAPEWRSQVEEALADIQCKNSALVSPLSFSNLHAFPNTSFPDQNLRMKRSLLVFLSMPYLQP